jgi:hypothetical protein
MLGGFTRILEFHKENQLVSSMVIIGLRPSENQLPFEKICLKIESIYERTKT